MKKKPTPNPTFAALKKGLVAKLTEHNAATIAKMPTEMKDAYMINLVTNGAVGLSNSTIGALTDMYVKVYGAGAFIQLLESTVAPVQTIEFKVANRIHGLLEEKPPEGNDNGSDGNLPH